jgi:hypothetical protein
MFGVRIRRGLFLALAGLLWAAPLAAQSTIAGAVRDSTGAVLPGVTVEASSPALIEKTRVTVTNDEGRYAIVDVRPGTYTITFTLTGFNTVQLSEIIVQADVSVPINADMKVGTIEETITVAASSPVVDVQRVSRTYVMSRDMLDDIPNARNIQAVGSLVPGVRLTVPDVGGTQQTEQTYMTVNGNSQLHNNVMLDGLSIYTNLLDGATQNYIDNLLIEEASYKVSGVGADSSRGGVNLNIIPRDGGNVYRGQGYFGGSRGNWQSNNVTQDLEDRQFFKRNSSRTAEVGDYNAALGGPILRDKVWFYASGRLQVTDTQVANATDFDGGPAIMDANIKSYVIRGTWQATTRNKLSATYQRNFKFVGHEYFTGFAQPTTVPRFPDAAQYREPWLYYIATAKWTSTATSRLLLEGGWSADVLHYTNSYQPGLKKERYSPEWYTLTSKLDTAQGFRYDLGFVEQIQFPDAYQAGFSASYVTGSHNLKVGIQHNYGHGGAAGDANGDLVRNYSNNTPSSVTVYLTPFETKPKLDTDLGIYAQDQWTIKRLTVNAGVRYEYLRESLDETSQPGGRFAPAATWPAVNCKVIPGMTCWHSVSPRLGLAYDVFGNGRTALNMSWGKYMTPNTTSFVSAFHPVQAFNPGAQTRTWLDVDRNGAVLATNGDGIAQDNEIGPNTNADYGIRVVRAIDENLSREFNRQLSVGVQHQVRPGIAATFDFYRRTLHNSQFTDNLNRNGLYEGANADWSPFTIVNPITGAPVTFFRLNQSAFGLATNSITQNFKSSGDRSNVYSGFSFGLNARLPRRTNAFVGWGFARTINVSCDSTDDPNTLRFCDGTGNVRIPGEPKVENPFRHGLKFGASVPIVYGFEAAAAMQSYAGDAKGVGFTVTPSSTRYPTDCAFAGCTPGGLIMTSRYQGDPGVFMQLVTPGTRFLPRNTQIDLSVRRTFGLPGNRRLQAEFSVFNLLNDNAVLTELQTLGNNAVSAPFLDGGVGGRPTGIMYPRLMRLAATIRF